MGFVESIALALFHSLFNQKFSTTNNWQSRSCANIWVCMSIEQWEHICMFYIVWATVGWISITFVFCTHTFALYQYTVCFDLVRFGLVVGAKMVLELLQNWQPASKSSPTPILTITLCSLNGIENSLSSSLLWHMHSECYDCLSLEQPMLYCK